ALVLLAGLVTLGGVAAPRVDSLSGLLGLALLLMGLGLWAARHALQGWASARDTADAARPAAQRAASAAAETPWYVTVLRVGLLVPVVLLLGVWVALAFELDTAMDAAGAGLLLLVPGVW